VRRRRERAVVELHERDRRARLVGDPDLESSTSTATPWHRHAPLRQEDSSQLINAGPSISRWSIGATQSVVAREQDCRRLDPDSANQVVVPNISFIAMRATVDREAALHGRSLHGFTVRTGRLTFKFE
jgi:hypothetical protein